MAKQKHHDKSGTTIAIKTGQRQSILDFEFTPERAYQHRRDRRRSARTGISGTEWVRVKIWQKTRLTRRVGQRVCDNKDYSRREDYITGVRTKVRVSERSDLDTGEAGQGRSDGPMAVAMEMATAATPTALETAGGTIFEQMERIENGNGRRKSEALAPSDWRRCEERTMRQQEQELTRLHRTVGHLTNLLEAQVPRKEAQWLGITTWMQEQEQKWDARHEEDKLWGAGITNMIAKVLKCVVPGQAVREKESKKAARMDGGGLDTAQHADTTQEEGPEECQRPRQQLKPKLQLTLQPKLQTAPKPKPPPTPARR